MCSHTGDHLVQISCSVSHTKHTQTRGDTPHGNMLNAVGLSFAACSATG